MASKDQPRPPAKSDEEDDLSLPWSCWAIIAGVMAMVVGLGMWSANQPVDPLDSRVTAFEGDGVLRTVVWAGRAGDGRGVRGPNGRDTDWAIFFYK